MRLKTKPIVLVLLNWQNPYAAHNRQNQNLVESNSPIAYDLRIEVYKMVDEGKTKPTNYRHNDRTFR